MSAATRLRFLRPALLRSDGVRRLASIALVLLAGCPLTEPSESTDGSPDGPPDAATEAPETLPDATTQVVTATRTEPQEQDPQSNDVTRIGNDRRPEWVRRGTRIEGGVYYGLGKVRGIRNRSLARTTADNRARAAVGRLLSGKGSFSGTLNGTEIVERWYDRKRRTHYSLARYEP